MEASQSLRATANAGQSGGPAPEGEPGPKAKTDDVVDAEFTEVDGEKVDDFRSCRRSRQNRNRSKDVKRKTSIRAGSGFRLTFSIPYVYLFHQISDQSHETARNPCPNAATTKFSVSRRVRPRTN